MSFREKPTVSQTAPLRLTTSSYPCAVRAAKGGTWPPGCTCRIRRVTTQGRALDLASLGYLQGRLAPAVATAGWPGSRQYRFEGRGVQVMLWSQAGQCDWWVSAVSEASLRQFTAGLLDLPGLGQALWSNDEDGERLLSEVRRRPR